MVGPALGGLVVAHWGEAACFALNAASFLAVLLALALMRVPPTPPHPPGDPRHDIPAGLRYAVTSSSLALVMGLAALMGVFALQFNAVLPLVARYELQTGSEGFGLLTSIVGVGSLACALGIIWLGRGGPRTMILGACGMGLCVLTLGLATHPAALYVALFFWGFCDILFFNTALMTIQLEARADMRGRVNSLYLLLVNGTTPLGSLLVGYLAAHAGVAPALRILGGLCLAGTLLSVAARAPSLLRPSHRG
jgi:MFS family permease